MMKKLNKYKMNILHLLQVRYFKKSTKYNLTLSTELEEIIIGSLLGDLHAEKKVKNLTQDYNLNNLKKMKNIFIIYTHYLKIIVVLYLLT